MGLINENIRKKLPEIQVAFTTYKDSYEKIPELLGTVIGWLMARNLKVKMPIMEHTSTVLWKFQQKN